MKIIKFTSKATLWPFLRQTPGSSGIWKDFHFKINDLTSSCDWWVVHDGIHKRETVACPKNHTVFVSAEPETVKKYHPKFLKQFSLIITDQEKIKGQKVIHSQPGLPWYIGYDVLDAGYDTNNKSYDELKSIGALPKEKIISVISSDKTKTEGHRKRLNFIEIAKKHFGEHLDIFGARINTVADKWEAMSPYKYHLAIENCSCKNYWSEKLTDAFLSDCHPIYYGCPNIKDYFPAESMTIIDIEKPEEALRIIDDCLKNDAYRKSKDARDKSKNLILDKYQIFPMIYDLINKQDDLGEKIETTIYPESYFQNTFFVRAKRKLKRLIFGHKEEKKPVFEKIPWITSGAKKWLDGYLSSNMRVFEYGSGGSSVYMAEKIKRLVTVEHDPEWGRKVGKELVELGVQNVDLKVIEPEFGESNLEYLSSDPAYRGKNFRKYVNRLEDFPDEYFDLIYIDGRARNGCLSAALKKVKRGGAVLLDNSEREEYSSGKSLYEKWQKMKFWGPGPYVHYLWETTIWIKPK